MVLKEEIMLFFLENTNYFQFIMIKLQNYNKIFAYILN